MGRTFFLIVLAVLLINCDPYDQMRAGGVVSKNGSTIETMEYHATALVEYVSHDSAKVSKNVLAGQASGGAKGNESNGVPLGGFVIVKMLGRGIRASADPSYWEFLIRSTEGNDILRIKGQGEVSGTYPTGRGQTFWSSETIAINREMRNPFFFYVFSGRNHAWSCFKIYPNVAHLQKSAAK